MKKPKSVGSKSNDPFASFGGEALPASSPPQTRQEARHERAIAAGIDPAAADALAREERLRKARERSRLWRAARKQDQLPASSPAEVALTRGQKAAATRAANALEASAPPNMTRGEKAAFTRRMNRVKAGLPASHAGEPLGRRRAIAKATETIAPAASSRTSAPTRLVLPQSAIDALDAEIATLENNLAAMKRSRSAVVSA